MKSEIFEKYAEIAKEKGLLSTRESIRAKLDDKEELNALQLLYNVKPNGKEDEIDILDKAHPDSIIIAPSYDRLNGLVESLKERHNVMVGIVNKPQQGKLTQHRYAQTKAELMNTLISLGFKLDNANKIHLCKLADSCAQNLVKTANPLIIAALIAAGVAGLYTFISQNWSFSQGVVQDANKAITEIQEAIDDYPQLENDVNPILNHITKIQLSAKKVFDINAKIISQNIAKDDKSAAIAGYHFIDSNNCNEMLSTLQKYKNSSESLLEELPTMIAILKERLQEYEPTHTDFIELGLKLFRKIVPTDMEDAWNALENLRKSLSDQPAMAQKNIDIINSLKNKVESIKPEENSTKTEQQPEQLNKNESENKDITDYLWK